MNYSQLTNVEIEPKANGTDAYVISAEFKGRELTEEELENIKFDS